MPSCLPSLSMIRCSAELFAKEKRRLGEWRTMNIFIAIMLILALLGLLDKMAGGKMGLGAEIDHGLAAMGSLALSLVGIYALGITAVQHSAGAIAHLEKLLPFDPSLLIGSLLAPDLGGYSIAKQMAAAPALGLFSGLIVASSLGCTISFVLPIAMSAIKKEDTPAMMRGIVLGIVTLPTGVVLGGLLLRLPFLTLLRNTAPILLICLLLCLALSRFPQGTTKALLCIGRGVQILSFTLFALVMAGLFIPAWQVASLDLVNEALVVVIKVTVVICGAMVLSHLALTRFSPPMHWLARKMRINEPAVVGLLLCLATSVSMLPLFDRMDKRGKAVNAAFSVSGAFVLGGQLAFVSSLEPSRVVAIYMISKLVGGLCAIVAALLTTPAEVEE